MCINVEIFFFYSACLESQVNAHKRHLFDATKRKFCLCVFSISEFIQQNNVSSTQFGSHLPEFTIDTITTHIAKLLAEPLIASTQLQKAPLANKTSFQQEGAIEREKNGEWRE